MADPGCGSMPSLGNRGRWIVLGVFAGGFLFAVANAAIRQLWFDELLTFHVSKLGNAADIWAALEKTADGQPPISYLLTAFFHLLLGETELATRLPSLLAFAIASYVFFFGSRRELEPYTALSLRGFFGQPRFFHTPTKLALTLC